MTVCRLIALSLALQRGLALFPVNTSKFRLLQWSALLFYTAHKVEKPQQFPGVLASCWYPEPIITDRDDSLSFGVQAPRFFIRYMKTRAGKPRQMKQLSHLNHLVQGVLTQPRHFRGSISTSFSYPRSSLSGLYLSSAAPGPRSDSHLSFVIGIAQS